MRSHLREVLRQVAPAEYAAVDLRDQSFDPAVEDFRKPGMVRDLLDRHTGVAERAGGAAGGQDFHAARRQRPRQGQQASFVGHRDQGAMD